MSYEPTIWKDGDLVTSAKLNKLEQGVADGGGTLIVNLSIGEMGGNLRAATQGEAASEPPMICDKTAGEIYEAFRNGNVRFIFKPVDYYEEIINLGNCAKTSESYYQFMLDSRDVSNLYAATTDDYPTTEEPKSDDDDDNDDNSGVR